jgi:plastocyanin
MKKIILAAFLICLEGCGSSSDQTVVLAGVPTLPTDNLTNSNGVAQIPIVEGAYTEGSNSFGATATNVYAGTVVTWVNNDIVHHDIVSDQGYWDSLDLAPGATFSWTFKNAGSFSYHCKDYPNMTGLVIVQPYSSVVN